MYELHDLLNSPAKLKFSRPFDVTEFQKQCLREGVTFFRVSLNTISNKQDLLERIGRTLEFPSEYIPTLNWDSFEEAIQELSWIKASRFVCAFFEARLAWQDQYELMTVLHDIILCSTAAPRESVTGYYLFVD